MDFFLGLYHFFLAWTGDFIYGHPSRNIFVIGVTGTKGKSTVVELINATLEKAGKRTAFISSVRVKIGAKSEPNLTENTMPGRFFIQRFLRDAVLAGAQYAILEVTSQGVMQYRHRFIEFDAALFLNLHPEHIESHGSYEKYRAAKTFFFRSVAMYSRKPKKIFHVNQGDVAHGYFIDATLGRGEIRYFSREKFVAIKLARGRVSIGDWLKNDFNLENAAAATSVAESLGIGWETIKQALKAFNGVPGRMEVVCRTPFQVVVDYAHTPDSLLQVYKFLRSQINRINGKAGARGKLICVLGSAGGGRDKWKRPELGRVAAGYCGKIFLTNEDPYEEEPEKIIEEIKSGILLAGFETEAIHEIIDRKKAIYEAVKSARSGDTVVLTGKGSERSIHIGGGRRIPWSDREAVNDAINRKKEILIKAVS